MINANLIKNGRELVAVFSGIDHLGICSEDVDTAVLEAERNILRQLSSDADNCATSAFELVDIHDTLPPKLLKVQAIGLIKISRDSLWIIVDHNRLLAHVAKFSCTRHCAPVEFDTAANAVNAGPENHRTVLVEINVMRLRIVGSVEVVGVCGVFSCQGVYPLNEGSDAKRLAVRANEVLRRIHEISDLRVSKAHLLRTDHEVIVHLLHRTCSLERAIRLNNVIDLVEVPLNTVGQRQKSGPQKGKYLVNLRKFMDLVNSVLLVEHRIRNIEQTHIGRITETLIQILGSSICLKTLPPRVDLADSFLQTLFKGPANSHDFAD